MNSPSPNVQPSPGPLPDCVELGVWTKIPVPPPESLRLELKEVDKKESHALENRGVMTFHAVGCTGCHADQQATTQVARSMAEQVDDPHRFGGTPAAVPASFLYHLGDVVYKKDKDTAAEQSPSAPPDQHHDFGQLYDIQFYRPYARYTPTIFAIAGNHDGKDPDPDGPKRKSAIHHFLKNFCGLQDGPPDNKSSSRPAMNQPYPYWLLDTPLAYFVGLYTNVNNAGQLDDPEDDRQPQFDWLVQTLKDIKESADGKAVLLALHYPPYSAAVNFRQRGDPNLGPTPRPPDKILEPLGILVQRAFRDSGQYPDAVLSAHAHHYQRLTWTGADGRQIPFVVVGGGGHIPVEQLSKPCEKDKDAELLGAHPEVVYPPGLSLPARDRLEVAPFNDKDFGFLRVTLDAGNRSLTGEYFTASSLSPEDSFILDLGTHTIR
jgi:hypothetical protein